jgi:hypothetical protein
VDEDLGQAFFLQQAEEGVEVRQGEIDAGFGAPGPSGGPRRWP